ncbi:MAG: hypothetical protein HRF49_11320 [bacterium]|jgi:hypothetical protein
MRSDKFETDSDEQNATGARSDIGELRTEVAKAAEKPDTTGHLVWIVIAILIFSLFSSYIAGSEAAWKALTQYDPLSYAPSAPGWLLDLAEVYGSSPSFTSNLTFAGAGVLLLLCVFSLFKRFTWRWIVYLFGLLVIGFFVNAMSWIMDVHGEQENLNPLMLEPNIIHILLGAAMVALFAIWMGEKFRFGRTLIVYFCAAFVFFEIQYSYLARLVVEYSIENASYAFPYLGAKYAALNELVSGLLLLGGLVLLMESLAFYSGHVQVKGIVFMLIVVAIPAAYLLWDAQSAGEYAVASADAPKVYGGVARHFQVPPPSKHSYRRTAYIVSHRGTSKLELEIEPRLRELLESRIGGLKGGLTGPLPTDFDSLAGADMLSSAMNNVDLELWQWPVASLKWLGAADRETAVSFALPWFVHGIVDENGLNHLSQAIGAMSFPPTALKIELAKQLTHRGQFVMAEELLNPIRAETELFLKRGNLKSKINEAGLSAAEEELASAREFGAGTFTLRVRVLDDSTPVWTALVGLQCLGHSAASVDNSTIGEAPVDNPSDLLTSFRKVDSLGEAVFDSFTGGRYRLVVLKSSLSDPEDPFPGDAVAEGLPELCEPGGNYLVIVRF